MAPGNTNKRKRPERNASYHDESTRPSPHRPEAMSMAHHNERGRERGRGGNRRQSRQNYQSPPSGQNPTPTTQRRHPSPQQTRATAPADAVRNEGSRPATPAQPAQLPVQTSTTPTQSGKIFAYDCVTDERVRSWQDGGRQAVLKECKEADTIQASTLVQEIVRAALDGRLDATEAGQTLASAMQSSEHDIVSMLLDWIPLLPQQDYENPVLQRLLSAAAIDPAIIRAEMDVEPLIALSLVRNTFGRVKTRKGTVILYKQANFNLLREESEGYAKLITEYFNTAQSAMLKHTDPDMAVSSFQRVMALVGAFDLDVGRVLDITLDVSANLLVRAFQFFLKFYRCSSWWPGTPDDAAGFSVESTQPTGFQALPSWAEPRSGTWDSPEWKEQHAHEMAQVRTSRDREFWDQVRTSGMSAFYQLGARRIIGFKKVKARLEQESSPEVGSNKQETNADKRKRVNENRKYMLETHSMPPAGNPDAAQLLGFKLRFYASAARNASDTLPENLVALAALLIKIGFISLKDLYPHLYPPDEAMPAERERLEREKAERERKDRPGAGANALATAGALADDTVPVIKSLKSGGDQKSGGSTPKADAKDETTKDELPTPDNQKIIMLRSLLLIGALPEALFILGRFPWLPEVDPTLQPLLHRIANHMLSQIGEAVGNTLERPGLFDSKSSPVDTVAKPDGSLLVSPRPSKRSVRWMHADSSDESTVFYYSDWADNIPTCQNIDDVFLLCSTFLGYLGLKIGQDNLLYTRLIRLAKRSLDSDFSEANRSRWIELLRRLLLPALTFTPDNPGITQEVFDVLELFPITLRFNMYAEWYMGRTSRLPDMRTAFDRNKYEVRGVLRRVTNESAKHQGRALTKVSQSCPGIVMRTIIEQLESYSNMIPALVETMRYFSPLAYDVITWSLVTSLSGQGRDTRQGDGMLTSAWLQALSSFVASLFSRHSAFNVTPVIKYVANELRNGNSNDLEVLEQILGEMAGIKADIAFNDAQVLAMAGGELLQLQTVAQMGDTRTSKKSQAKRLMKTLAECGLTGQILISIARELQVYANKEDNKFMPLKVLGNNLDKIQSVYLQYLDVLRHALSIEEFTQQIPGVLDLVRKFGLDPGVALAAYRHVLAHNIAELDEQKKRAEQEEKKRRASQGKESAADSEMVSGDVSTPQIKEGTPAEDVKTPAAAGETEGKPLEKLPWHPVLVPIIEGLSQTLPHLRQSTSLPFYVTFWTLVQQDILVHTESYEQEIKKLNYQIKDINVDRTDLTSAASKERDRKRKALLNTVDDLSKEMKGRIAAYTKIRNRLTTEKSHWFERSTDRDDLDKRHVGLLQECFLPRSILSPLDAHYCFLMLKVLHNSGTPGFSTMHLLHQFFKKQQLAAFMFQCTATEAQNFGRFLRDTLGLLQHWHADKATYEKEAFGSKKQFPGFAKKLDANGSPEVLLEFEDFRRLLYNWHSFLNGALKMCFESGEYMHIRNGFIVLRAVASVFPSVNFMGRDMLNNVEKMSKEEPRQDLKLVAASLIGPLRQREKSWTMPQAFRLNDPGKEAAKPPGSRAGSARPETPNAQEKKSASQLNAHAAEFKMQNETSVNHTVTERKESLAGPEEGEVEDVKMEDVRTAESQVQKLAENESTLSRSPIAPNSSSREAAKKLDQKPATPLSSTVRTSTPMSVPAKPPPRQSARAELPRPMAGLPNKPENTSRPSARERPETRYPPRHEDRYGRLDRPGDIPSSRERSPVGRNSRNRTPERDPYYGSSQSRGDVRGPAPMRDDRSSSRAPTESRPAEEGRSSVKREPLPPQESLHSRPSSTDGRGKPNGHPASHGPKGQPSSEYRPSSSGMQMAQPANESVGINPARLAMIEEQENGPGRRREFSNKERDSRRQGPPRVEERMISDQPQRIDPGTGGSRDYDENTQRTRRNEPGGIAPAGPRGNGPPQPANSREPFDAAPPPRGPAEVGGRGRLRNEMGPPSAPQDSSYGRLNGPHETPPVGPRQPNGASARGGRSYAGPPLSLGNRSNEVIPSPAAPNPPDSPASYRGPRHGRRESRPSVDRQQSATSAPSTPSAETNSLPGMHPARAAALGAGPPQIQTNVPQSSGHTGAHSPAAPPSGPRGSNRPPVGTPSGPSPTNTQPPSGPGGRRSGPVAERQRANINAQLQGSETNAPPPPMEEISFRGASTRQNEASSGRAQPQSVASAIEPQPRGAPAQELFSRGSMMDDPRARDRRPRYPEAERQDGPRSQVYDRRVEEDLSRRPMSGPMDDQWQGRGPPRNDRRSARGDGRDQRIQTRGDELPPRRQPQGAQSSSFQQPLPPPPPPPPPADWETRAPRGPDDGRKGPRADGRAGRGQAPRDDPMQGGRKRRHEEGPPEESKRRRSGR